MKPMLHAEIMKTLVPSAKTDPVKWELIGRELYLKGMFGSFVLSIFSSGNYDGFHGLEGTYTSNEGAKDRITFRFGDLLEPHYAKSDNPSAKSVTSVHIYCVDRRDPWHWYIVEPVSLKPLHQAINAWVAFWNKR